MYTYLVWTMLEVLVAVGLMILLAAEAVAYRERSSVTPAWPSVVKFPVRGQGAAKRAA